ncbi:hypothetical protein SD70_00715 [Gordoniibacillus kamchatkensis]|uniref:Prepilin leader peptidase/N-methyltransferase n=1 Tax=Gordoniibacillus kamchatkensis TaxID=1590651 RepID=A0ABR5ANS9_9BACL|nr:hypothetical protein SD70_00715 [Paenibacillus sp. VKM B-2647]
MFGLAIGSFLNVVAIRIPQGQSIVRPPSRCPHCEHRLGPADLIPVASYLFLRGKCRYCRAPVSPMYAAGEAAAGALFAVTAWKLGFSPELAVGLLFVSILLVITLTDLSRMIIPDKVVFFGMAAAFVLRLFIHPLPLWNYALAFFAGSGLLLMIGLLGTAVLRKESMGGGDVKLFAFIGLVLGVKLTLLSVFAASLFGTLFGVIQLARGRFRRNEPIPFGPFIAAGAFCAYFWGDRILDLYFALIFR